MVKLKTDGKWRRKPDGGYALHTPKISILMRRSADTWLYEVVSAAFAPIASGCVDGVSLGVAKRIAEVAAKLR